MTWGRYRVEYVKVDAPTGTQLGSLSWVHVETPGGPENARRVGMYRIREREEFSPRLGALPLDPTVTYEIRAVVPEGSQ